MNDSTKEMQAVTNDRPAQLASMAVPQNVAGTHKSPDDWKPLGDKPSQGGNIK